MYKKLLTTHYKLQAGVTIVEIVIATAVLGIIFASLSGTLVYGIRNSEFGGERERAIMLANEGLEAVRNIRDEDFTNLVDGTYGLTVSSNQWTFSGIQDISDGFTRETIINSIDVNTKEITTNVTWDQTSSRPGSVSVTTRLSNWGRVIADSKTFRVIEYYISPGQFSGVNFDLTLNQDLESNYFVIVQGSDGDASSGGTRGPDENYIALTGDPLGTGDLDLSGSNNILSFTRGNAVNPWVGNITVAECLGDCANSGFELLGVERINHNGNGISGNVNVDPWGDSSNIMIMGGFNGAGCNTSQASAERTKVCHVRMYPALDRRIVWTRNRNGGANPLSTATSTAMILRWGSEWNVQRIDNLTGNNGGNGANQVGEYNTAAISSVKRVNTWIWGTGHTDDNGIGDSADATLITLGDGVNKNATESVVAMGQEYMDSKNFTIYSLTHPSLAVDYQFKSDGHSNNVTYDIGVVEALDAERRMSLIYNGTNGTGTAFPRPMWSSRYSADNTVTLERRRSGQNWPAWVQGIDFSNIEYTP